MIPADMWTGGGNLRITQRGAMDFVSIGLIGRTHTDYGFATNHRRLAAGLLRSLESRLNSNWVMAVDIGHYVPTVCFETLGRVVREPPLYVTVNGNAIIVVKTDQLAKTQCACQ